jgi:BirA family biotin operon repressor/biotin-[acetyl-CoA-carboxylase] ligase
MHVNEQLLQWFNEHEGQFVSGQQLSQHLGISRTAVWKRIKKLEKQGYQFESAPKLGYRLIRKLLPLQVDWLKLQLQGNPFAREIHWLDRVDSTQTRAHQAYIAGATEGTVILAEQQHAGRGRFGREWHSPAGTGIYMSLILCPRIPLAQATHMTLLISVSLCRAIRKLTGANVTIKWPNDLLIKGYKISGILVDTIAEADQVKTMIAGIGISVNMDLEDFPEPLRAKATSLKIATGHNLSREQLIISFFKQFEELYAIYLTKGFAPIRHLWEALTSTLQSHVVVTTPQGQVAGLAEGITENGALRVRDQQGQVHTLYSGDLAWSP